MGVIELVPDFEHGTLTRYGANAFVQRPRNECAIEFAESSFKKVSGRSDNRRVPSASNVFPAVTYRMP
jgi:hypothetical protein